MEQVARPPGDRARRLSEQIVQYREVVFRVVYRQIGIGRRRPGEPGRHLPGCLPLHLAEIRDAAGAGPLDVECVERRNARARLARFQTGIRDPEALGGGAEGNLQQQLLALVQIVAAREAEAQRVTVLPPGGR